MQRNRLALGLYLMTSKGVAVLQELLEVYGSDYIAFVVTARDCRTEYDGYEDIRRIAFDAGIAVYSRTEKPRQPAHYLLAVSWRWLICPASIQRLIVFHDSLLPRYRGFAPLVSALVNGDTNIGVTALFASEEYDRGDIIGRESIVICYPITIEEAIKQIVSCYKKLCISVVGMLMEDKINSFSQDESAATYSLWLDEDDYFIDWNWDATRIQRFVDAVGFPYRGAATILNGKIVRVRESLSLPDVMIENRTVGKVIFTVAGCPVVVCGEGLLQIMKITESETDSSLLPLPKFRIRFLGRN